MTRTQPRDSRRLLLDAARDEYTEYGIAGARVDRIATKSGVNKQRIYAYFGNKEGLFAAVMNEAYRHLAEEVPVPTTQEGLRRYVGQVFDFHRSDNSLVRLLAWEGLYYGQQPIPDEEERLAYYEQKGAALTEALGVEDPMAVASLLLTLIGIASWPFIVEQQRRLMLGTEGETEEGWRRLRTHLDSYGEIIVRSAVMPAQGESAAT